MCCPFEAFGGVTCGDSVRELQSTLDPWLIEIEIVFELNKHRHRSSVFFCRLELNFPCRFDGYFRQPIR